MRKRFTRRDFLKSAAMAAGLAATVPLLEACAQAPATVVVEVTRVVEKEKVVKEVVTATPAPATPTPVIKKKEKIARIGMTQEPDTLYPPASSMYVALCVMNLLYDGLVQVTDKMELIPNLAEEVPTLENGGAKFVGEGADKQLQVTFKLRKDAVWADGTPFTSKDVKFTWELIMNPQSGASTDLEMKYEKVETPDDWTAVFTFYSEKSARASGGADFAQQEGPVLDPTYMFGISAIDFILPAHKLSPLVDNDPRNSPKAAEIKSSDFARNPVGTGRYTLKKWEAGTLLTLVAKAKYHRGAAKIGTAVFWIVPSKDTLIGMMKAGDIDVITQDALDVSDVPLFATVARGKPYVITGTTWEHVDCNAENPILSDAKVRQALMMGADRKELIDKLFLGLTKPVHTAILDWSWAYNPGVKKYSYEPDKANALLDQIGWSTKGDDGIRTKDGKRLSLKFQTTDSGLRKKTTPLLKDQWAKIGVEVLLEHMPGAAYFAREGPLSQGNFELGQYAWVGGYDPGAGISYAYHSRNIPTKENNFVGGNFPRWKNADNDRLLDAGMATLSKDERIATYAKWQNLFAVELPTLPLYMRPNTSAAANFLKNFKPGISSIGETWNIHEWDIAE